MMNCETHRKDILNARRGHFTMRLHQRHHDGTSEECNGQAESSSSLLLTSIVRVASKQRRKRPRSHGISRRRLYFSWSLFLMISISSLLLYTAISDLLLWRGVRNLSMLSYKSWLDNSNEPGRCPELLEATRFAFHQVMYRHPNRMALPKVKMIQLVGEWKDIRTREIMEKVFRHNQQMLIPHGIEAVAISQPPTAFMDTFPEGQVDDIKPPFWKMGVMYEHCQETNVDLLWYLDGDTLIMDPHARVEFLWLYHSYLNQQQQQQQQYLDMLFAHDWYGFNAGIILVNCTSPTAMLTLRAWQDAAVQLLTTYNDHAPELDCWYEQKALHFMLNTWQWNHIPANHSLHWDDYIRNIPDKFLDADTFSSESLTRRIRHTSSQCALNNSPPPNWDKVMFLENDKISQSPTTTLATAGPFIVHTAGLKGEQKSLYLDYYQQIQSWSKKNLTWQEAAISYLRNHPFSYIDRELEFHGVYEK